MKKRLDIEYMRKTLKLRTGVRAGKNDKPKKPKKDDPVAVPMYGIITPKYGIVFEP